MRALIIAGLAMLGACATQTPPPPASSFDLTGTSWRRVDDEQAQPHVPTIAFTADGASGFSGCNRWFTSVTRDASSIDFGNVGMTRMACTAAPAQAAEQNFASAIARTRFYTATPTELVLMDEAHDQVARFERDQ